jgi:serine protease Do
MRIPNVWMTAAAGLALLAPGAMGQNNEPFVQYFQTQRGGGTSFLGVGIQEVNADRARELRLPAEEGVEITRVDQNSPAATAGLMVGDVVLKYNNQDVEGMEQFARLVRETPAGRDVKLQIVRNGNVQTVTAKIGSHAAAALQISPFATQPPGAPDQLRDLPRLLGPRSTAMGIETEPLNGQLADYFGAKDGGVLVRSVVKNSAAERAGIKAGDVITRVGDAKVTNGAEITAQLRAQRGVSVSVTLVRDHREITVSMPVENRDNGQRF